MEFTNSFPFPDKVIIKKGYFPETTTDIEDSFCFVNLDVDIYESTKCGLTYFYPRMEKGGIIMIHDYNNYDTPGVKKAIDEFALKNDVNIVMVSDDLGSAIITKI